MASARVRYIREMCCLFTLTLLIDLSEEVSVQHVPEVITARDSDSYVILPCDFHTETYETPQITWYHEILGERRLIMRYDIQNRLSSYGEFKKRVVRGDRGALVLLGPRSRNSGKYSCEVEVDNEFPSWVKSTVMLRVTKDSFITKDDSATNTAVLITVYWLISVTSALLLNAGPRTPLKTAFTRIRNMPRKQRTKHVLFYLAIAMAMGLILAGVICAVRSVRKPESPTMNSYHWTMSLITGIPGILILSVITVYSSLPAVSCCKRKRSANSSVQETFGESPAQSTAVSYIASSETGGTGCRLLMPDTNTPAAKGGTAALPVGSTNKLRITHTETFQTPKKESVNGMVSLEDGEVYVTTKSGLFKLNVTEKDKSKQFQPLRLSVSDCLGLMKDKRGLLCLMRANTELDNKLCLLPWTPCEKKTDEEHFLQGNSTILWVQEGRGDGLAYVALSNPDVVSKRNLKKRTDEPGEEIWTSVLKKPECIIQNPRGQFIVADSAKNDLFVFEEDGEFLSTMKVSVPKEYEKPLIMCNRIAVGKNDRIFASSPNSNDILVFSEDFRFECLIPTSIPNTSKISCLLVHNKSLYIAHGDKILVYAFF